MGGRRLCGRMLRARKWPLAGVQSCRFNKVRTPVPDPIGGGAVMEEAIMMHRRSFCFADGTPRPSPVWLPVLTRSEIADCVGCRCCACCYEDLRGSLDQASLALMHSLPATPPVPAVIFA